MKLPAHRILAVTQSLLAGILSVLLGFGLWFAALGLSLVDSYVRISMHKHETGSSFTSGIGSGWGLAFAYGGSFALSAFLTGRLFPRQSGLLPGCCAYAVFLVFHIPRHEGTVTEWQLFIPLLALPAGSWLSKRSTASEQRIG
ncbi:MAG: hypothetical protein JNN17_07775 [Verrucomicrobiaceae bacterium]|nr:hypothetical protein [Verrucomicrobiaceae bacterium]